MANLSLLPQILRAAFPDSASDDFGVERIGEAYGLGSQLYRCSWRSGAGPQSVIIKVWNTRSAAGTAEVFFYQTFGRNVGARIPRCFYAEVNRQCEEAALVLEDFSGAVQGDCLVLLSLDQARAVARSLAGIHTRWLEHERLQREDWLASPVPWERDSVWFNERSSLFLQRFGDRLDAFGREFFAKAESFPEIINDRAKTTPLTLIHGDFHADNLLFERGTEPVILDWPLCARGPLAWDLAELVFDMSPLEAFDDIFTTYLAEAADRGVSLDRKAIESQLGGALLRKFVRATYGVARWESATPRINALIATNIDRTQAALNFWCKREGSDQCDWTFI